MKDYTEFVGFLDPNKDREDLKDVRGAHRTESLFVDVIQYSSKKTYTPIYTLRDYDWKDYPSAYLIYITSIDEREAALKLVGSMSHWRKLCSLNWFMEGRVDRQFDGLTMWRSDMADRDSLKAKKTLLSQCKMGSIPAARALEQMSKGDKKRTKVKTKTRDLDTIDSTVVSFLNKQKGEEK